MKIVELPEILAAIDEQAILAAIETGFRRHAAGDADLMAVGHLRFGDPPGDCHVKGGYLRGDAVFVVKLATSFYRNPEHGLAGGNAECGGLAFPKGDFGVYERSLPDMGSTGRDRMHRPHATMHPPR
jgi:hypothetical protein